MQNPHIITYMYIYIYICVCVLLCVNLFFSHSMQSCSATPDDPRPPILPNTWSTPHHHPNTPQPTRHPTPPPAMLKRCRQAPQGLIHVYIYIYVFSLFLQQVLTGHNLLTAHNIRTHIVIYIYMYIYSPASNHKTYKVLEITRQLQSKSNNKRMLHQNNQGNSTTLKCIYIYI